ncbi:pantothenate transporter liz1 [Fusarium tricinctum]|uniref:Pantothenate transporter liz1 n=1 Tax=Fusarium tricinctum TaxID=61284 RepID=A0A8K0W697_9HYPO|nr:pantothenate transporter liz1 [Fusarium tricinctum]
MESESKINSKDEVKMTQGPTTGSNASVVVCEDAQPVPPSVFKRFLYHLWDNDQHLKSPEERKLVRKLDFGILICATLGWWMKYIDQNNIVNAYVSGMKEDLNMQGNEYTYMLMCYTIAFAIMQIPSNAIALKIRPRICIVVCELGWTIFTFAQAAATSSNQMYAFRFMIGLFESGFSPIIIFLLGSWYNKAELAKRMAIWHITGFFGAATSGFLQAAVHRTLDGRLGLPGWRWMYIICGCMSLPVALSVWWFLPDLPHNTEAWYITEEEKQIALRRSATQGKVQVTGKLDKALAKRMFGSWRWWVLCVTYILYGNSCQAAPYFAIYLRESGYSVTQRNIIPGCANLVSMVTDFTWSFMSDYTRNRIWWMVGPILCTTVVSSSILTAWPPSDTARVVAFFFAAGGFVTGVTWTWANEINIGNAEERALTISSMNGLFYATNSFLPILIFPQTMAPKFERGFPSVLSFALGACCLMLFADFLHKRELRLKSDRSSAAIPVEDLDYKIDNK